MVRTSQEFCCGHLLRISPPFGYRVTDFLGALAFTDRTGFRRVRSVASNWPDRGDYWLVLSTEEIQMV